MTILISWFFLIGLFKQVQVDRRAFCRSASSNILLSVFFIIIFNSFRFVYGILCYFVSYHFNACYKILNCVMLSASLQMDIVFGIDFFTDIVHGDAVPV